MSLSDLSSLVTRLENMLKIHFLLTVVPASFIRISHYPYMELRNTNHYGNGIVNELFPK